MDFISLGLFLGLRVGRSYFRSAIGAEDVPVLPLNRRLEDGQKPNNSGTDRLSCSRRADCDRSLTEAEVEAAQPRHGATKSPKEEVEVEC